MTAWSRERPTKAGWYWFMTEVTEPEICRVYQDANDMWWATFTEWDEVYRLDDVLIGAEFQGPLQPKE
jgi:hypothetical protein